MFVVLLLILSVGLQSFRHVRAESATLRVPDDFSTIQEAINNAVGGDTVFVKAGTYYEHVVVNKALMLIGEDVTTTIIDGNETGLVINITSDNVNITGFTVQGGGGSILPESSAGIHLGTTSHCNIFGNRLLDNYVGIIGSPKNATMSNNIIAGSHVGFDIFYATFNTISGNRLVANNISIHMLYADSNSVFENNITDNYLCAVVLGYSVNNRFYHNNFLNNTEQIVMLASGWTNSWDDDYLSGGNYWSDYSGLDQFSGPYQNLTDSDGIGDTPVALDGNNTDRYPLMTPWTEASNLVGDVTADGKVDMKDVGYVARRFMCVPGDPLWDPMADMNDDEKINMVDIGTVARHFGESGSTPAVDWWPMRGHDLNHTGYSTSTAPNTNKTIWIYTTGEVVCSSPAVADGKVYVGSANAKVYAFASASTVGTSSIWLTDSAGNSESTFDLMDNVYVGIQDFTAHTARVVNVAANNSTTTTSTEEFPVNASALGESRP